MSTEAKETEKDCKQSMSPAPIVVGFILGLAIRAMFHSFWAMWLGYLFGYFLVFGVIARGRGPFSFEGSTVIKIHNAIFTKQWFDPWQ